MEIIAVAIQTVAENQNVLFTDSITCGNCSVSHRNGSGLVNLRGTTTQCRARYKVSFGANIALSTGGVVAPISVALSIDGEPVGASTMTVTPAAAEEYNLYHLGGTDHSGAMSGLGGSHARPVFSGITEEEYFCLKERKRG